jgi:hypothetical protein
VCAIQNKQHKSPYAALPDCADVWRKDIECVIRVQRYHFFPPNNNSNSPNDSSCHLLAGTDEPVDSGPLSTVTQILLDVHARYFSQSANSNAAGGHTVSVPQLLAQRRGQILAGCNIVFSRVRFVCLCCSITRLSAHCCFCLRAIVVMGLPHFALWGATVQSCSVVHHPLVCSCVVACRSLTRSSVRTLNARSCGSWRAASVQPAPWNCQTLSHML